MPIMFKDQPLDFALGRRVNAEEWNGISRTTETDKLKFAVPVKAGSGAHTCAAITVAAEVPLGITEASQILSHPGDYYEERDTVAICESGVIGVMVSASVTKGAQAGFNPTTGKWQTGAASGTNLHVPGAYFEETGGADGEIVPLRYRRVPGEAVADS